MPCWKLIGAHKTVLSWIAGYKIPFHTIPIQASFPKLCNHSILDHAHIANEIQRFLTEKVISKCTTSNGEFLSTYFVVDKSNG